jgi:hypothetical protein
MNSYTISSKSTGADLGTFSGETEIDAYAAMCRDAGYDVTVVNGELFGSEETLRLCDVSAVEIASA